MISKRVRSNSGPFDVFGLRLTGQCIGMGVTAQICGLSKLCYCTQATVPGGVFMPEA